MDEIRERIDDYLRMPYEIGATQTSKALLAILDLCDKASSAQLTSYPWLDVREVRTAIATVLEVKIPKQPYGPGAICEDKKCEGHFAHRHNENGCDVTDLIESGVRDTPCECDGFLWLGNRWPRPWLSFEEGGMKVDDEEKTS